MSLTPTKRQMNWTATTFVTSDASPVTTTITGVTSVDIDLQGSKKEFSGDGDMFVTTLVHDFSNPQVTVQTADLAALHALVPGLRGTFTSTHNDAKNGVGVGGGGYTVVLSQAMVNNNPTGGKHREFGEGSEIGRAHV